MGDYQENLVLAVIITSLTVFIMSWDCVVPTIRNVKKVFNK